MAVSGSVLEPNSAFSEPKMGSDRKFGLTMFAACLLFGSLPLLRGGSIRLWLVVPGLVFLAAALLQPRMLAPLHRAWLRLGHLLSRITNPIVMAGLFFCGVWPVGAIMRLCGARPLGLKFESGSASYWHIRTPRDQRSAMRKQF
jgi:hypothetical protein